LVEKKRSRREKTHSQGRIRPSQCSQTSSLMIRGDVDTLKSRGGASSSRGGRLRQNRSESRKRGLSVRRQGLYLASKRQSTKSIRPKENRNEECDPDAPWPKKHPKEGALRHKGKKAVNKLLLGERIGVRDPNRRKSRLALVKLKEPTSIGVPSTPKGGLDDEQVRGSGVKGKEIEICGYGGRVECL